MTAPRLQRLPRLRTEQRPPRLPRPPLLPTGPKHLGLGRDPQQVGGPGEPPTGFVGARNSRSEWIFYWGLSKALGTPPNPRIPPFRGGEGWSYQEPYLGGADVLGGSIIDFVVYAGASKTDPRLPFEDTGIRLQTERFHIFRDSEIQQNDVNLFIGLSHILRVVDAYEQEFIGDETGQAVIVLAKQLLAGTESINPLAGGTARRVRPA